MKSSLAKFHAQPRVCSCTKSQDQPANCYLCARTDATQLSRPGGSFIGLGAKYRLQVSDNKDHYGGDRHKLLNVGITASHLQLTKQKGKYLSKGYGELFIISD
jgi:hypothetical protein